MLTVVLIVSGIIGFAFLSGKIKRLESRIAMLEKQPATPSTFPAAENISPKPETAVESQPAPITERVVTPSPAIAPEIVASAYSSSTTTPLPPPEPNPLSRVAESVFGLVRKNPFASAGVLMLLIGFGFLFSLLAANNILPPIVRVALVALLGVAMFGIGLRQEKVRPVLGLNLQGGALALEYLCALWAYQGYGLISASAAFVWLGGLSTLALAWSMRSERSLFAFIGLAGALLTPVIAGTDDGTFSSLALYSAWVGLQGIAVGLRLRAPSLASTALAGSSLLLGAALDINVGSTALSAVTLAGMTAAYGAAACRWARDAAGWTASQRAAIVSVLIGAPLVMAGFLNIKADVSAGWCAVLLAAMAAAYLLEMRRTQPAWKGWLLSIGAGLALVAIGVGLEGAARAIALAASAMGLILLAQAMQKPWANLGALLYWFLSVLAGWLGWKAGDMGTTPLFVSGAVALGAGFVAQRMTWGLAYPLAAPLVFALALLQERIDEPQLLLIWFLGWALAAQAIGYRLKWSGLRLSAIWLLPAGLPLYLSTPNDLSATGWAARELLLGTWLACCVLVVWLTSRDGNARTFPRPGLLRVAAIAVPVLCQVELARGFSMMGFSEHALIAASMLLWSAWSALAEAASRHFDGQSALASVVAALLIFVGVAVAPLSLITELSQWCSLALLAWTIRRQAGKQLPMRVVWALAGAALTGSLLRAIGAGYGLVNEGAMELALTKAMQPWVSLLWAAAGVAVVVVASRRLLRPMWVGGGIALAVLVGKMLLVDLSAFTLVAKVGVFLAVGLLFLGLGYFCPLPPEETPGRAAGSA
jgi:hypothetical protein